MATRGIGAASGGVEPVEKLITGLSHEMLTTEANVQAGMEAGMAAALDAVQVGLGEEEVDALMKQMETYVQMRSDLKLKNVVLKELAAQALRQDVVRSILCIFHVLIPMARMTRCRS